MKFFVSAVVGLLAVGVVSTAPAGDASDLEKRSPPLKYFKVHAPPENISPEADAAAKKLEGLYLFNYNYDKYVYGDIYIGKTATGLTGGYYTPIQYFFDPVHTSYNGSQSWNPNMNLIVKQSSQGEAINYPFVPPNTEYWVATGYQLLGTGQVTLYNVQFPGWSACLKTGANGGTYYQLFYQNFGPGCTAIQLFVTDTPPS